MKILVCGSRNWTDRAAIEAVLSKYPSDTIVVNGAARGADSIADSIARSLGMKTLQYPYLSQYGKAGGAIRNQQMLDKNPDIELVIAFSEDLYSSKGTKHMVSIAKKARIPVEIYGDKT